MRAAHDANTTPSITKSSGAAMRDRTPAVEAGEPVAGAAEAGSIGWRDLAREGSVSLVRRAPDSDGDGGD